MRSIIDYNDDGKVTPEEEALTFLLLTEEDEKEESDSVTHYSGCLMSVMSIIVFLIMVFSLVIKAT